MHASTKLDYAKSPKRKEQKEDAPSFRLVFSVALHRLIFFKHNVDGRNLLKKYEAIGYIQKVELSLKKNIAQKTFLASKSMTESST